MSTTSSRQLDRASGTSTSSHSKGAELTREVVSPSGASGSSSAKGTASGNGSSATSGVVASQSPGKARISSSSSRGRITAESTTTLSSSGSPNSSPRVSRTLKDIVIEPSSPILHSSARTSTTQTKRVIPLDDESKDSSMSKEGESEDFSEDEVDLARLIEDPRAGLRSERADSDASSPSSMSNMGTEAITSSGEETLSTSKNLNSKNGNSGIVSSDDSNTSNSNNMGNVAALTTRSLSADPSTTSGSKSTHSGSASSSARGLPSISESDVEPASHGASYEMISSSKKKRRKHGSQRAVHTSSSTSSHRMSDVASGYASESTLGRHGGGGLDESDRSTSSYSPAHSRGGYRASPTSIGVSSGASTGPIVPPISRERSASRDSPIDTSVLMAISSARSEGGSAHTSAHYHGSSATLRHSSTSRRDRTRSEHRSKSPHSSQFASADGRLGVTTDDESSSMGGGDSPRHSSRRGHSSRGTPSYPDGLELQSSASHLGISTAQGGISTLSSTTSHSTTFLSSSASSGGTKYSSASAADSLRVSTSSATGSSATKKKSKRPSKHEMLSLHGVWAYEREGKMQIFGGTTSKIIGKLLDLLVTSPDRDHIYFLVHVFLHGARQFYNAAELLSVLLKYWDLKGEYPDPCGGNVDIVRSSIIFFLAAWFEKRFLVDFGNTNDSAKPSLEKFMRKLPSEYLQPLQSKLKRMTTQEPPIPSVTFIKPLMSSTPSKLSLLDVKPAVLAGQWTLLDMRNFQSIQLSEFLATSTSLEIQLSGIGATGNLSSSSSSISNGTSTPISSPRPAPLAPRTLEEARPEWTKLLERAEAFTKWIAYSIVSLTSLSQRTKALKRTLTMAIKFLELNNFHGLMCTWGALNTIAVRRLVKTFRKLPRSSIDILRSLDEKLSESNNFANLRWSIHKQRAQGAALIPWFELVAKNRNLLDEYDDVVTPSDFGRITRENRDVALYSFSKFAKLADQVEEFLACQHNNRHLDLHSTQTHTSEQILQNWLSELQPTSEDELWKLSLICEPLDASTGDSTQGS